MFNLFFQFCYARQLLTSSLCRDVFNLTQGSHVSSNFSVTHRCEVVYISPVVAYRWRTVNFFRRRWRRSWVCLLYQDYTHCGIRLQGLGSTVDYWWQEKIRMMYLNTYFVTLVLTAWIVIYIWVACMHLLMFVTYIHHLSWSWCLQFDLYINVSTSV